MAVVRTSDTQRLDGHGVGDVERLATIWASVARRHGITVPSRRAAWLADLCAALAEVAPAWGQFDPAPVVERRHERILLADGFDAWLLAWPTAGTTELHDHGGAAGAFVVVDGELIETTAHADAPQRDRRLRAGAAVSFGRHHVHDVVNVAAAVATSVHVYSPPIRSMTYYAQSPRGRLVATHREPVLDEAILDLT